MEELIVIGVVVAAAVIAGGLIFRSMRAQGGCGCGGSCSPRANPHSDADKEN